MQLTLLKSKLHRGTVTSARIHYPGSLGLDSNLMEAANLVPYERVLVADLDNGQRLETYVIESERGSGDIEILGAAARLIQARHKVIIMAFGQFTEEEARGFKPRVVVLGENNTIVKV